MNERYQTPDSPIYLRPLREDDIDPHYLAWFADPEVTRFLDARDITRADAVDHLRRGIAANAWRLYAICLVADDRHVGNLKIGPVHWRHLVSDMVTVIGERSVWGQGIARQAITLGIDIAFRKTGIRKLSASIDSLNTGSIRAYTSAGFEIETVLKRHFMHRTPDGVIYSDKVYVACFNPNFDQESDAS